MHYKTVHLYNMYDPFSSLVQKHSTHSSFMLTLWHSKVWHPSLKQPWRMTDMNHILWHTKGHPCLYDKFPKEPHCAKALSKSVLSGKWYDHFITTVAVQVTYNDLHQIFPVINHTTHNNSKIWIQLIFNLKRQAEMSNTSCFCASSVLVLLLF